MRVVSLVTSEVTLNTDMVTHAVFDARADKVGLQEWACLSRGWVWCVYVKKELCSSHHGERGAGAVFEVRAWSPGGDNEGVLSLETDVFIMARTIESVTQAQCSRPESRVPAAAGSAAASGGLKTPGEVCHTKGFCATLCVWGGG